MHTSTSTRWFPRPLTVRLCVGLTLVVAALIACSNQAEGDRCDALNGDSDCGAGLVCTKQTDLTGAKSDRCCPADRSRAVASICKTSVSVLGTDGSAPADTGPPVTPASDASAVDASDAAATRDAGDASDGG